jgi:uncharacterized protein
MADKETSNRGFGAMPDEKREETAGKGGHAAHEKGTAHEFSSQEAREAGRKGGEAVSGDREHMSDIGQKGDSHSHGGHQGSGQESSGQRGGSSEQHAQAGRQSHKND